MKTILLLASIGISSGLLAQNATDAKGLKQGPWSKNYDQTNQPRYKGQFKDNLPVGKFTYYEISGEVSATVEHVGGGVSYSKTYNKAGKMTSQGKFINQKKDSIWSFYAEDGILLARETYKNDIKDGKSLLFNEDSVVSLEQTYVAGKLNGKATTYFGNGKVESENTFVNGLNNGVSKLYSAKGTVLEEGTFTNGKKTGLWKFYNQDGSLRIEREYVNDQMIKEKRVNGEFEEYFPNELLKAKYTYRFGKPDGPFVEYREGGTWVLEERTDSRTENKESYRVPKNHVIGRKGNYTQGKLNGKVEIYGPYGNLEKTENYVNGELQ